jgi:hypothetical protein
MPPERTEAQRPTALGADKAKVGAAAKLLRQLEPVGQLGQQYHPARLQMPCASAATSKRERVLVACTARVTFLAGNGTIKHSHPP